MTFCVVKEEVADGVVVGADILHASDTASLAEAKRAAEDAARANQEFGYDEALGAWWGRNAGSLTTRFTAVDRTEAARMIGADR